MKSAFFLLAALVGYGSLYPFDFSYSGPEALRRGVDALFAVSLTGRGDVLGNLALFVPFGLLGMLAFGPEAGRVRTSVALLIGGVVFAALLQLAQLVLPTRDASGFDVFLNALGIGFGLWLASLPPLKSLAISRGSLASMPIPLVIAMFWPMAQLLPLIPTVDAANVRNALKPVLNLGTLSTTEAILSLLAWLAALMLLIQPPTPRRWTRWAFLLPLLVLLAQPFILGGRITSAELAGSLLAVAIWIAAGRRIDPLHLGLALLAAVLASNLLPWVPTDSYRAMSLIPFSGFLEGHMLTNAESLVEKVFLFSATIWLLSLGGIRTAWATVTVTIALAVQEMLQAGLARGTPEITDPLLAGALGVVIARLRRAEKYSSNTHAKRPTAPKRARLPSGLPAAVASGYLPGLNGLRAIAALSVFGVHLHQMAGFQGHMGPFDLDRWLTNGNTGVALFFMLSGFLLALPFLAPVNRGVSPPHLGAYFVRRLARILPAYYLCLFGLVAIDAVRGGPPSVNNILSHLIFVYNINDWQILSLNEPFWTLAVEVQFYLLLPFLVLGLRRLSPHAALVVALALAVGAYLANRELVGFLLERDQWPIHFTLVWPFAVYISGPKSFVLTYSTLAHLTFFLAGIAMATLYPSLAARWRTPHNRGSWVAEGLFWFSAAAVFVILSTPLDDTLQIPFGRYNWPFVPLLLGLLLLATPHTRFARHVLEWWPLWALGAISYGIYIFHHPILRAGEQLMRRAGLDVPSHWPAFAATTFAASVVVSTVSYLFIERPIMRWARGPRHGRKPNLSRLQSPIPLGGDVAPDATPTAPPLRSESVPCEQPTRDQWTRVMVYTDRDRWTLLRTFARANGLSPSGAVRLLTTDWLFNDVGSAAIAAHSALERARPQEDRRHWCEVNLRQQHLPKIEQRLETLNLSLNQLIACLLEHRRGSLSGV